MHIDENRRQKTIDMPERVVLRDALIEPKLIEKARLIAAPRRIIAASNGVSSKPRVMSRPVLALSCWIIALVVTVVPLKNSLHSSSMKNDAAVHVHNLPGNEVAVTGCQEQHRADQICRRLPPSKATRAVNAIGIFC